MRALAVLLSLAKNSIPAVGVLLREWAAPGALLVYLGENVVLALLAALTVRIAGPPGHDQSLRTFFYIATPFTFGAAVLTGAVVLIRADKYTLDPRELLGGLALMVVFQLIAFAANLRRVRGITLPEGEDLLVGVLGRVFLLAFAVWAGLLLALFVTTAFVIPFMILKTIADLYSLRPDAVKRRLLQV